MLNSLHCDIFIQVFVLLFGFFFLLTVVLLPSAILWKQDHWCPEAVSITQTCIVKRKTSNVGKVFLSLKIIDPEEHCTDAVSVSIWADLTQCGTALELPAPGVFFYYSFSWTSFVLEAWNLTQPSTKLNEPAAMAGKADLSRALGFIMSCT